MTTKTTAKRKPGLQSTRNRKPPETIPMLISTAIWLKGERFDAGSIVELPLEMARSLNASHKAEHYNEHLHDGNSAKGATDG